MSIYSSLNSAARGPAFRTSSLSGPRGFSFPGVCMIAVEGKGGDTAGCHPCTEGDGEPMVTLFIRRGKESLAIRLTGRAARQLGTSLGQDAEAIYPMVRVWRAENESLEPEDILNPSDGEE